jgi:membrane-associated phospholipid phosphatase
MRTFYSFPFANLLRLQSIALLIFSLVVCYSFIDIPLAKFMITYITNCQMLCRLVYIFFNGKCILPIIGIFCGLAFVIKPLKTWRYWLLALFLCLVIGQFCLIVLKPLIGRARPYLVLEFGHHFFKPFNLNNQYFSFPSGHTINIMLLFGFLSLRYPLYRLFWIILGFGISMIRMIDGSHFFSDCLFTAFFALSLIPIIRFSLDLFSANPYVQCLIQGFKETK